MSGISAYYEPIGPISIDKHRRVSDLMTEVFNNRMQQLRYCFICDVEKVINFLDTLNSERLERKFLTYKLTMSLALTGSSRAHETCYLDICYIARHSSSYIFHFYYLTKTAKNGTLRLPIKILVPQKTYVSVTTLASTCKNLKM